MARRLPAVSIVDRAWRWIFPSRQVTLELHADVESTVAALRERVIADGIRNALRNGVVGRVEERGVRVRWRTLLNRNSAAPEFVGRFAPVNGRMCLVGELRASQASRAMLAGWIGFIVLWWVLAFVATVSMSEPGIPMALVLVMPPLMIAFAAGVTRLASRLSESHGERLEYVLLEAIEAAARLKPRTATVGETVAAMTLPPTP